MNEVVGASVSRSGPGSLGSNPGHSGGYLSKESKICSTMSILIAWDRLLFNKKSKWEQLSNFSRDRAAKN